MKDLVSIIVPIYNVEMYLNRCLESIHKQSYKNLEILLIDDGSTDNSYKICQKWEKIDERIKVFHIQNGGVSNARNIGINNSKGKYIVFIDSDDYIDKLYIEKLITSKLKNNTELCLCGYYKVQDKKKKLVSEVGKRYILKEYVEIMKKWKMDPLIGSPWNKLFDKHIIDKYNIRFKNDVIYAEDYMFNVEYLMHINSVYIIKDGLYYYNTKTPNSLTKRNSNDFIEWTSVQKVVYLTVQNFENLILKNKNEELSNEIYVYMFTLNIYERVGKQNLVEIENFINEVIKNSDLKNILMKKKRISNLFFMNIKFQILRRCVLGNRIKLGLKKLSYLKNLKGDI